MAIFALNQPIQTSTPTVTVDNKLSPGVHTFQLEVVDNLGRRSDPVKATVTVQSTILVTGSPGLAMSALSQPATATVTKAMPAAKTGAGPTSMPNKKAGPVKQAQPAGRSEAARPSSGKPITAKKKSTAKKSGKKKRP